MLKPNKDAATERISVLKDCVLFIDCDAGLRNSRHLLLSSLRLPIHTLSSYAEVFQLPELSYYNLVVINVHPIDQEVAGVAEHVRRRWPEAKVLLLGDSCGTLDDPLYDDIVDPNCNAAGVIRSAQRLLEWMRTGRMVL